MTYEPTPKMIEAACKGYWPLHWPRSFDKQTQDEIRGHMRSALIGALRSEREANMGNIETVARSDAAYDGRTFDGLGRAEKERYLGRAWAGIRALEGIKE